MIPKVIHYCWFGKGELPDLAIKCIESWKKHLPDYEIIEWNENNFDINKWLFTKQAYEMKKYAFVSDVCRLHALQQFGGVYMDTDVEVLKPIDPFLDNIAFSGFEDFESVPTGIMASVKDGDWVNDLLEYYNNKSFINAENNTLDMTTNVDIITNMMVSKGIQMNNEFQTIPGYVTIYPKDFFCPKNHATLEMKITDNTICIHHFAGSWLSKDKKIKKKIKQILTSILGNKTTTIITKKITQRSVKPIKKNT